MSTLVVYVYPSQLKAFKEKADLLASEIEKDLKIKFGKFKRYEYLARGIGYPKGHDRLIENAKRIAQADPNTPLNLFSDPVICRQIGAAFNFYYEQAQDITKEVQAICESLGAKESDGSQVNQSAEMDFYEELSKEIDDKAKETLKGNVTTLDPKEPEQWCQDMAFKYSIPQEFSAQFLKETSGLDVDLLPEPEMFLTITNEDGSDALVEHVNDDASEGDDENKRTRIVIQDYPFNVEFELESLLPPPDQESMLRTNILRLTLREDHPDKLGNHLADDFYVERVFVDALGNEEWVVGS